ncbi:nuclear transport factor 2B-like [Syzygium oleosum]|uniref:nuclear transport factor 2B-like n=1 Tax=Syzygium oleosum TaxID=219896 RepID=UPI0024B98C8E|nr:nuclear transport factor 2B-like [Syzygium oleosum]
MDRETMDLKIAEGQRFLENYYRTFDANRADMANLYREESVMIFDGRKLQGKEAILAELTSLQQCRHQILTIGCQPTFLGSSDLVGMVSGNIWLDGKQYARLFNEAFMLLPTPEGSFYVSRGTFVYPGSQVYSFTMA